MLIPADVLDAHPRLGLVNARIVVEPSGVEDPIVAELRDSPVPGPDWLPGPALGSFLAGASVLRRRPALAAASCSDCSHAARPPPLATSAGGGRMRAATAAACTRAGSLPGRSRALSACSAPTIASRSRRSTSDASLRSGDDGITRIRIEGA